MRAKKEEEMIPELHAPNTREIERMTESIKRRALLIGRDQRTYSGIYGTRIYIAIGFLCALLLMLVGAGGF